MSEEKVFFDRGNATVTSARIMLNGTTYALRNVTSVTMRSIPPSVVGWFLLGGLILLIALSSAAAKSWSVALFFALIGGLIIWAASTKQTAYVVAMSTSAGQIDALRSTDKATIQGIVDAINDAIVHKS